MVSECKRLRVAATLPVGDKGSRLGARMVRGWNVFWRCSCALVDTFALSFTEIGALHRVLALRCFASVAFWKFLVDVGRPP